MYVFDGSKACPDTGVAKKANATKKAAVSSIFLIFKKLDFRLKW